MLLCWMCLRNRIGSNAGGTRRDAHRRTRLRVASESCDDDRAAVEPHRRDHDVSAGAANRVLHACELLDDAPLEPALAPRRRAAATADLRPRKGEPTAAGTC